MDLCFFFYVLIRIYFIFFFFNDTATTEIYTLSLHDALPISSEPYTVQAAMAKLFSSQVAERVTSLRSEEHTSELQSQSNLVCRLLLEKKKKKKQRDKTEIREPEEHMKSKSHSTSALATLRCP